jgi:uncharacterized protein (DUF1501 family)
MLEIGSFRASMCQGVTRRAFVRAGMLGPAAWALSQATPAAGVESRRRARSVLVLWLWGAPSHLDTFDPKPRAQAEYRGPFGTIATRTPGVRFSELLPQSAAHSDRFTLIRSNKNFHSGHLEAGTWALTGFDQAGGAAPNFGSVIARHRGARDLPPFLSIGRGNPRDVVGVMKGYGGGSWGKIYDPFLVDCGEDGSVDIPSLKLLDGLSPAALHDRGKLLADLDRIRRTQDRSEFQKWDATSKRAFALLTSAEARKAFDLSREDEKTRDAYGRTSFGQSCLLARRLVQAGVPYIQVNWSQYAEAMTPNCDFGWDTHIYNFELLSDRHCPIFDRVYTALLEDLAQRGLLETTLVLAMGEFGRTPRINSQASRDHWTNCYFSLWAGAGIPGGKVIGESDKYGNDPTTEPITPLMVGTTIAELAGLDTQARAELGVLRNGTAITELV